MTEISPEVEGFDSTAYRIADGIEVAFVATEAGPVRLGQGDPLPEGVHPDEVARLANGGVLADFEAAPELLNDPDPVVDRDSIPRTIDDIKVRVGVDPAAARAFLDHENAQERPRPTLVAHLEGVIAGAGEDGPVVSADAGPGAVSVVDDDEDA